MPAAYHASHIPARIPTILRTYTGGESEVSASGTTLADGLFGVERGPLQGKPLSYNNVLDAAAASQLGRALRDSRRRNS